MNKDIIFGPFTSEVNGEFEEKALKVDIDIESECPTTIKVHAMDKIISCLSEIHTKYPHSKEIMTKYGITYEIWTNEQLTKAADTLRKS